jgi:DNA ligase-1
VRRAEPQDADWQRISYRVFELPDAPGSFAERAARIETLVAQTGWHQLVAVPQQRLPDAAALQARLDEVLRAGGEGLVLHLATAPYQTGRSEALLKLKPREDAEGVVTAHLPGKGRHTGRLGALQLRLADGRLLRVGTGFSDAERADPPPLGSLVSFSFEGRTRTGLPRFARYLRRHDGL